MMVQMSDGQTEAAPMNEATMQMLGNFTVLRLMSLVGTKGVTVTKKQLLAINEQLNKIRK